MKKLVVLWMVLGCLCLSFAQGLQGHVILGGKATVTLSGHSVTLVWNAVPNATGYNVYRGTTHGGPYSRITSGIVNPTYTDVQVTHNQTLYYVTTAVQGSSESGYSNELVVAIP